MYRYAALFLKDGSEESRRAFESLLADVRAFLGPCRVVYERDGLVVLDTPDTTSRMQCHVLDGGGGVILGHLFTPKPDGAAAQECRQADPRVPAHEASQIIRSGGKHLLGHYWGSYIAVLAQPEEGVLRVLRSPFGTLPCFHFSRNGVSLLFSDMNMASLLKARGVGMDWSRAPLYLAFSSLETEATGIDGVETLAHGQMMEFEAGAVRYSYLWDPTEFAVLPREIEPLQAMELLRGITMACFAIWAGLFSRSLLTLSGGFDSSLVAGGMAALAERPELACVIYYYDSPLIDEREYARLTAAHTGFRLYELPQREVQPSWHEFWNFPPTLRPYMPGTSSDAVESEKLVAERHGLTGRMTGLGGDALFFAFRGNLAAKDYYHDHGLSRRLLSEVRKSAVLSGMNYLDSLKSVLSARWRRERSGALPCFDVQEWAWGLSVGAAEMAAAFRWSRPWLEPHAALPPGKSVQIGSLMTHAEYFKDPAEPFYLEPVNPLLSQPIAELCLSLPSYVHQFDGRERGLARRAFADYLVDEVRLRQFKSNGSPQAAMTVAANRDFFAEFLLDGVLASKGLLDRPALERLRSDPSTTTPTQYIRMEWLSAVEAWARAWA